jgi:hypothetical protein
MSYLVSLSIIISKNVNEQAVLRSSFIPSYLCKKYYMISEPNFFSNSRNRFPRFFSTFQGNEECVRVAIVSKEWIIKNAKNALPEPTGTS